MLKFKSLAVLSFFIFAAFLFLLPFSQTRADIATGLVSHWKLDETSGTTAVDSAGTNTGTVTGATWTTGKLNNALSLNGTSNYASVPRMNYNEITVAGWFNKTGNDLSGNNADSMFGAWDWNSNTQLQEGFDLRPGMIPSGSTCPGVAAGSSYLCSGWTVITTNGTTKTQKNSAFNLSSISKNGTTTD